MALNFNGSVRPLTVNPTVAVTLFGTSSFWFVPDVSLKVISVSAMLTTFIWKDFCPSDDVPDSIAGGVGTLAFLQSSPGI